MKPVVVIKEEPLEQQLFYRIQFASYKKEKKLDFRKFRGLEDVGMYIHEGLYKYTTGNESSLGKAVKLKEKLRSKGYKDVFIVAFLNEERISIDEAKKISESQN